MFVVAEGADEAGGTLDTDEDAVAGVADPAEVEIGGAAAGDDGEGGGALIAGAVVFDALEEGDHVGILEAGIDVLADELEEEREILGLGADGGAGLGRGELALELLDDFLRGGLGGGVVGAVAVAPVEDIGSPGDRNHEGGADVEKAGEGEDGFLGH